MKSPMRTVTLQVSVEYDFSGGNRDADVLSLVSYLLHCDEVEMGLAEDGVKLSKVEVKFQPVGDDE